MDRFEEAYQGTPPWDIGRPQPEVIRLADSGAFRGNVLDVGCGTGENSLYLRGIGCQVTGVDLSSTAIRKAREKRVHLNIKVTFKVLDALQLSVLEQKFDTILDSALFHVFTDEDRIAYVRSLESVLAPDGTIYLLCFSDKEPPGWGPRRVTRSEIRAAFGEGWKIHYIREAALDTLVLDRPVYAWLASIGRADS